MRAVFEVGGMVIIAVTSIGFALLLEWLSLWGLLKLMPGNLAVMRPAVTPMTPLRVPAAVVPVESQPLRLRAAGR